MNIESCKEQCCGCSACLAQCPKKAISMQMDSEGFLYPHIEHSLCVDCSLCMKTCPVYQPNIAPERIAAYYGWNRNDNVRAKSSSGGVFSALADETLAAGGVVFGAAFDPSSKLVRYLSTDEVPLDMLRRSKYTECQSVGVYPKIRERLNDGKRVLFCGTPCHVAGLYAFLGERDENLITCDFVCGGSSSAAFLREHLQNIERKNKRRIKDINFRDKKYGWKRMTFTVKFEDGKEKSTLSYFDCYFTGFIEGITKRKNCFSCTFADHHYSDVTIADFWGYRRAGLAYDKKGISMLVVNTKNGQKAIDSISDSMELYEIDISIPDYTIRPRTLNEEKFAIRENYFKKAEKEGFDKAAEKYYMPSCYKQLIKDILHLK